MTLLFVYHDGSILKKMSAKDLSMIPIWDGNRIIDEEHIRKINATLKSIKHLDHKPYHIVSYVQDNGESVSQIIDGQHRATILRNYFNNPSINPFDIEDFQILVIEKIVTCEEEIIEYFKILNQTKAIQWREDPKMVANKYVDTLIRRFNTAKKQSIRPGKTRFPYISSQAIREVLISKIVNIQTAESPSDFAERIVQYNISYLNTLRSKVNLSKDETTALGIEFALGLDKKMKWIFKV